MAMKRAFALTPLLWAALGQTAPPERLNSELSESIERYSADRGSLARYYSGSTPAGGRGGGRALSAEGSAKRRERLNRFYAGWLGELQKLDFGALSQDAQVDYIVFKNHLSRELRRLELESTADAEVEPLLPFAPAIIELDEALRRMQFADGRASAELCTRLAKQIGEMQKNVEAGLKSKPLKKNVANRAAAAVERLRSKLRDWFTFYQGYDPLVTWWVEAPYKELDKSLQGYRTFLLDRVVGTKGDRTAIVGDPVGREALLAELRYEMIPYTPEELVAIAEKEYAWSEAEMKRASRDLGLADDWRKALDHVKTLHVEPGKQPELIRRLAAEAIEFIEKRDLVTIPELARETFRMQMMTPERQLVNPFFTGGDVISVSFPTSTMTHEQKLMSMRGNNIPFSHATVFHELIPGHHLQSFMAARYRPYRSVFATPFLSEGWALYWEMLLWDLNFNATPEDRVGALFWRMHRCARIVFSLSFHLEKMTPEECVDYLVQKVGHERDNAAAEVRRSLDGTYAPLYQIAYMVGGLQLRALHRELVGSGRMTNRQFHDAVLRENRIPIEMIRASLTRQRLARDFKPGWRFYETGSAPRRMVP